MPLLVAGQVRYFDPDIDVPPLVFNRDSCTQSFPAGGGVSYSCSYSTMGRVAVIGRAGHVSGTEMTNTWNQYFTMSGNDARYLTYTFGPNCKLEKVTCGPAYYAECGITSTYRSCTQRFCLRAAQSYLGACTIKVELNPDAACTNTNNGMLWNHQSNTITLERDFNFMLPDGQVLPRGMGQNSLGGNTLAAIGPAAAHLSWRSQKAVMKLLKFEAVITVCLALAGRAAAASAWGVITSVDYPELSTTAALLKELGWAGPLSGPFTGTLLLPNNDAWDDYIRSTDYLPTLDASGGKAEAGFFAALMRYHTLLRAVADPYVGGTWSTKHMKEPGFIRHKISFENDSIGVFAVDEQEGTANIANTRSQKVDGGGYIHVIAAVLEPDDLFKSSP
ncbi:hypothetical protein OEZ86_012274 [Tetradesmus obliquus]|nr:hypothetical protein OEZ86_012274 [Tetradesmus obliquus]